MRAESVIIATDTDGEQSHCAVSFPVWQFARSHANQVAPSTRIPVTPGNRTLLRKLRAAEQAAWETSLTRAELDRNLKEAW